LPFGEVQNIHPVLTPFQLNCSLGTGLTYRAFCGTG